MENYDYGQSLAHASTVFLYACYVGDVSTVDKIVKLNYIKNLAAVNYHGYPPMVIATCFNRVDVVKCLIARDFPTNVRCIDWVTPLHYAMLLPDTVISEIFIRAGASYSSRDKLWRSPIIYASCNSSPDLLYLLSQKLPISSETDRTCMTVLHYAAIHGSIQNVRFLMENYPELAVRQDRQGRTPLHYAVYSGYKGIIKCLLKVKRQNNLVNMPDNLGFTPLHIAAIFNNVSVMKKLILKGAKIEACNSSGVSIIHLSCKYGNKEVLESYIWGAEKIEWFTAADCNKLKPIHYCIMNAVNPEIILDFFLQFYKSHNLVMDESDVRIAIDLILLHNQFNCLYLLVNYNFITFEKNLNVNVNVIVDGAISASAVDLNGETVLTEMLIMDRFNKKLNSRFFEMIQNDEDYNKANRFSESPLHILMFDLHNFNNLIKEKKFAESDIFFIDKVLCNDNIKTDCFDKHNHSPLMNYLLTFSSNFILSSKNFIIVEKLARNCVWFSVSSFFHCTPFYVAVKLAAAHSNVLFLKNVLNLVQQNQSVDYLQVDPHNKRNLLHVIFKFARNEEFLIDAIKVLQDGGLFSFLYSLDRFDLAPVHYYLHNCCSRNSLPNTYIVNCCLKMRSEETKQTIPLLMFFLHFSKINISHDVCELLHSKNDTTYTDQYKNSIFHSLAKNKNSYTTEKVLQFFSAHFSCDTIVNSRNANDWSPFHVAAYLGNMYFFSHAVKFLHERATRQNLTKEQFNSLILNKICTDKTRNQQTVLHLAANCSNTKLIAYILELYEDSLNKTDSSDDIISYINFKDAKSNTSLHYSVNNENNLILLFESIKNNMLKKQKNVIAKRISKVSLNFEVNLFNQSPLHLLCLFYNVPLNLFELIFKYSNISGLGSFFCSPNQIELTPMHCLVMGCQLAALFTLTEYDQGDNNIKKIMNEIEETCVSNEKFSLLHSAVLSANLLVIKFVISYIDYSKFKSKDGGLPISSKYFGRTPLHLACKLYNQDSQKKTKNVMKDMISVLLILCIHGKIDVNTKDRYGETAAMYAIDNECFKNNEDFINLINFDAKNDNNENVLHRSIRNNDEKLASMLLVRMSKDQLNTQLKDSGKTVLHLAVEYDMSDLIETLLSYGADRSILDHEGNPPFEQEENTEESSE